MHGIFIGRPLLPLTAPSQSPVPVGLTPDWNPNGGVNPSICCSESPFTRLMLVGADGRLVIEALAAFVTVTVTTC